MRQCVPSLCVLRLHSLLNQQVEKPQEIRRHFRGFFVWKRTAEFLRVDLLEFLDGLRTELLRYFHALSLRAKEDIERLQPLPKPAWFVQTRLIHSTLSA